VSDGLLIPASAILPGENGGTDVMVVASDGTVHRQAVTLGIRTTNDVQIISGLSSANTVVTEGGYGLDDGTKVTVDHAMHAQDGAKN
jgi:multidrug efflux pump subunit AcrA (membrane-fusion protein)